MDKCSKSFCDKHLRPPKACVRHPGIPPHGSITSAGMAAGLWISQALFKNCPQPCALTGREAPGIVRPLETQRDGTEAWNGWWR